MKFRSYLVSLISLITACSKSTIKPNEDVKALIERFHGKYKPVSSTSSEAIDVNLDGTSSANMLDEIPNLADNNLELLIDTKGPFLLVQSWPEQYFATHEEPSSYDPALIVNYVHQAKVRTSTFDEDIRQIHVDPDIPPVVDSNHFTFPKAVTVEAGDRIQVVSPKRLYTRAGWKKVEITTVYQRYTKVT